MLVLLLYHQLSGVSESHICVVVKFQLLYNVKLCAYFVWNKAVLVLMLFSSSSNYVIIYCLKLFDLTNLMLPLSLSFIDSLATFVFAASTGFVLVKSALAYPSPIGRK
jgi:hypothetical protein